MIYVSQGHEKGIGLEIFLNSILSLSTLPNITLSCNTQTLVKTLNGLRLQFTINNSKLYLYHHHISLLEINNTPYSQTLQSLLQILDKITPEDTLITMPSSKDQFKYKNIQFNGHTDFFRNYYNNDNLTMNFLGDSLNLCLITDHIPLKDVSQITHNEIYQKIRTTLLNISKINNVYIAGINPHVGEEGLLGAEDKEVYLALDSLKRDFPNILFHSPESGDILLSNRKFSPSDLYVFNYHDQGLGLFKYITGFNGINVTLGLPFTRYSVDHGTAFSLYLKKKASYQGMNFIWNKIKKA